MTSSSNLCTEDAEVETVEVVGGVGASISYKEMEPSECPREFLATHLQKKQSQYFHYLLLAPAPVLGDVLPGDLPDVELHVDLVPGVHSHNLMLII